MPGKKYRADDERFETGEAVASSGTPIFAGVPPANTNGAPATRNAGHSTSDNVFAASAVRITDAWLNDCLPERDWLLTRTEGGERIGYLPAGKVGMLVAQGGVGKSMALLQLAVAVATGSTWLDTYSACRPGRVLLAFGEETEEDARRRLFDVFSSFPRALREAMSRAVRESIVLVPLSGKDICLVKDGEPSSAHNDLMTFARQCGVLKLIVLDPLSRFGGAEAETDNAAATRFVEVLEQLTTLPGTPTVLLAHHSNKVSRAVNAGASSANARGSSALTDGMRWVSELRYADDEERSSLVLSMTKTNYTRWEEDRNLRRGSNGVLCGVPKLTSTKLRTTDERRAELLRSFKEMADE